MLALAMLVVVVHMMMAAAVLPALWGKPERRGERWAVLCLLGLGLLLAVAVTLGWRPPSPWKAVEAVFRPVGNLLFRPGGR